jgi:ABC-type lipoprotein release transport system permease subunit
MYLILSWRNIWRNKRRTLIVAASVLFSVFLAIFMRSQQIGSYDFMIRSSAELFTGYYQVQDSSFWSNRSIEKSMDYNPDFVRSIESLPHTVLANPRFETFALISHGDETRVSQVIGVDPAREMAMSHLERRLVKGEFLRSKSAPGFILGQGLAEFLKVDIGDSVVIFGQGYHGIPAAALQPVIGIVKLPIPVMNNTMSYLSLVNAQNIYFADNKITSISVMIEDTRFLNESMAGAARDSLMPDQARIMPWWEMAPELQQHIEFDSVSGVFMLAILYTVIALGILGTVMMMMSERRREFGIMIAVGMAPKKLMLVTILETLWMSFLGVFAGILLSLPILLYLNANPVYLLHLSEEMAEAFLKMGFEPYMYYSAAPAVFLEQAATVGVIALLTIFYPVTFLSRLKPNKAIRQ